MSKTDDFTSFIKEHLSMPDDEFSVRLGREDLEFLKRLIEFSSYVLTKFEKDEAQGYRSADRKFAITLLAKVLRDEASEKPSPTFLRDGDWWIRNGDGTEHRLLDLAPNLEREALKDPKHVADRLRNNRPPT